MTLFWQCFVSCHNQHGPKSAEKSSQHCQNQPETTTLVVKLRYSILMKSGFCCCCKGENCTLKFAPVEKIHCFPLRLQPKGRGRRGEGGRVTRNFQRKNDMGKILKVSPTSYVLWGAKVLVMQSHRVSHMPRFLART